MLARASRARHGQAFRGGKLTGRSLTIRPRAFVARLVLPLWCGTTSTTNRDRGTLLGPEGTGNRTSRGIRVRMNGRHMPVRIWNNVENRPYFENCTVDASI